jgi:hypothetical protein
MLEFQKINNKNYCNNLCFRKVWFTKHSSVWFILLGMHVMIVDFCVINQYVSSLNEALIMSQFYFSCLNLLFVELHIKI